jgi:hypothetical protein
VTFSDLWHGIFSAKWRPLACAGGWFGPPVGVGDLPGVPDRDLGGACASWDAPAALSTWLNGGVAPAQVAEWAGHSVEVLLRTYARCLDGQHDIAKRRIVEALDDPAPDGGKPEGGQADGDMRASNGRAAGGGEEGRGENGIGAP